LPITATELNAIAAPTMIGLSSETLIPSSDHRAGDDGAN